MSVAEKEELKQVDVTTELAQFDAAKAEVDSLKPYLELTVSGVDDKEGLEAVKKADREAQKVAKKIEDARVILKKPYWDAGKQVDATARVYSSQIDEIRTHLGAQKKIVTDEQLRLKRIETEERNALVASRQGKLHAVGYLAGVDEVAALNKESFMSLLQVGTAKHKERLAAEAAEKKRQAELAEANRIEQERLQAEREKQEAEAAAERDKLRVEREEMKAGQDRIAAEQAEAQRKIDEANAATKAEQDRLERIEFERNAKIEAEKKAREAARLEAAQKAEADEAERLRKAEEDRQAELMKTDSQKLSDLVDGLDGIAWPELESEAAVEAVNSAFYRVSAAKDDIRKAMKQ